MMLASLSLADATSLPLPTSFISWRMEYSHYSLVTTVEAIFNLGTLGRNDTAASPMADLFRRGIP
jgi:hypothetical protein